MKKLTSLPNHYSTIEDLTLYRWDRYTSTKDNNWFLVDYDGRQQKITSQLLTDVENDIQDQYFKAIDDRGFSVKMQKWAKMDQLATKYRVVDLLINGMFDLINNEHRVLDMETRLLYVLELKKWGFKIPELNSRQSDSDLLIQFRTALEGVKTQIAIISNELKDDGKKEHASLLKQLRIVELGLGYGYRLDPKKITVSEWIEELKLLEEKAKQN
jgi:hypothetical protein